jgi:Ca2+-binding RTX toxin-like protein
MGGADDDAMISPSVIGFQFFNQTEVVLTGAGDDELKWGNKNEILIWGAGQGNDEVDADIFFIGATGDVENIVQMQGLTRDDVTIGRGDGPIGNDVVITINATGETLTFRNLLMADNSGTVALQFADGEQVNFGDLEALFASLVETGTDGDDTLYQRTGTVLDGGAGDDVLMGGEEATTYVFGRGYGSDEIVDDRGFGPANTLQFGPGIELLDLIFERPTFGDQSSLLITIADTGEQVKIRNQFANELFIIDTFRFEGGLELTSDDILSFMLEDTPDDDRLTGSARDEAFGFFTPGNDTFVGLGGDDLYLFNAESGQDVVEDHGYGRFNPDRPVDFYRDFYVDKDRGDLAEIGFAFDELTVSRATTKLTFLHEPSGAQFTVDNTESHVERYKFAGDDYVYTLPEVMELIDGNIEPEVGSDDDDLLTGDDNGNDISGGLGDDTINGGGGPDTLSGDAGNDLIDGGDRGNTPSAYRDDNTLNGGEGEDSLIGGWENDLLDGGADDDRLEGEFGQDTYIGSAGDDLIISTSGGGTVEWALGDGNDLVLGTNDGLTTRFGAGITPGDLTYSIERVDIDGLSDYYEFDDPSAWGLRVAMPDGSVSRWVGSSFGANFSGMDSLYFTETGETVTVDSILADLYEPSEDDQIFVGTRNNFSGVSGDDVFAPGGGYDQIFFDSTSGTDIVSIGLGDGENVITGQVDRLAFESDVQPGEVNVERLGPLFEDFLITLADGTTVTVNDAIQARQSYDEDILRQTEWLGELRFGDGTVTTLADLLSDDMAVSSGDDITTGDIFANDLVQSAGNDTLRGSGGGDEYHFGSGAGQDVIIETAQGFAYYPDNNEFTFYNLSELREIDTLRFGAGLTVDDLTLTRTGASLDDLRIEIDGQPDSMLISNQFRAEGNWGTERRTGEAVTLERWRELDEMQSFFSGGPLPPPGEEAARTWGDEPLFSAGVERFVFADGTEMTRAEFEALVDEADNSGDNVISTGTSGGILDGGAGNDELRGGTGDDAYRFDEGYDSDFVVDAGGTDSLDFGAGLNRGQLTLTRTGDDLDDLLIEVGGQVRTALYVEGQFAGDGREVEVFNFADGTTLTAEDIRHSLLTRQISNGGDSITGFETSDLIDARKGDDEIELRGGNDIVDGGEGFDTVVLRGPRADYAVEVEDGRIVVTDLGGRDGVNRLYNVERLVFADDPLDEGAAKTVELVENVAPDAGAAAFTLGEDGRLSITAADLIAAASDPDGASVSLVSVGAVSGGDLEPQADGSWRYTPEADFNGEVTFDYVVEDAGGLQATGTATIEVTPVNDAPVADQPIGSVDLDEDTALAFDFPADAFADIDGDALSLSLTMVDGTALPDWMNFDGAALSGTPPQDWSGFVDLKLTASDGAESAEQFFAVHVLPVNDAPEAVGTIDPQEVTEGDVLLLTLSASSLFTDVDGDAIALEVSLEDGSPLPEWLSFDPVSGVLSGVAPDGSAGTLSLSVRGSDGPSEAVLPLELDILASNAAPELVQSLPDVTVDEDGAVDFTLPAGFVDDPDGDTLDYRASLVGGAALPAWLGFDPETLAFTGQPPSDWNGELELSVEVSDGEFTVADAFTLRINPVNDAPVVATVLDDKASDEDQAVSFALPENAFADVDGDALTLTATLAGGAALPAWLTFDGSRFNGQPPADFNGALNIEVATSDGVLTVTQEFTLSIDAVNDAPLATDDDGFVATGSDPLEIDAATLLANDNDVDGDTLAITSVSDAVGGTVSLSAGGVVTFVADDGFEGEASFTYVASDGALEAEARVSVDVVAEENPYEGWWIGTESKDWMFGGLWSENQIFGAGGRDWIFGGFKADSLHGGDGRDRIYGLSGADDLAGQGGDDRLFGGRGEDTISGGAGDDHLWGGDDSDTFVFRDGDGKDRIQDFEDGGWHGGGWGFGHWFGGWGQRASDVIALDVDDVDSFDELMDLARHERGDVVFDFGDDDSLTLEGMRRHELEADDFVFV